MTDAATTSARYSAVPFSAIAGWAEDDHLAALQAFLRSCAKVAARNANTTTAGNATKGQTSHVPSSVVLPGICEAARAAVRTSSTKAAARAFFEAQFTPHRVVHAASQGMVTGYYEPVLKGSRTRGNGFETPVLRRPPDLLNLVDETERGAKAQSLTHVRVTADGLRSPYPTRREIDEGALAGQGLEILYLANPVDLFFMQVQGSGRIDLGDGTSVRLTYDGKNGHPYTSVGRYLIDTGLFTAEQVSLQSLETWLKADAERGRSAMWQNKSYVFFRELKGAEADGPHGALSIPLSAGRSLAIDTGFHALGLPVWVSAPTLVHATPRGGFQRLMIAQDVGSAIRGPERGDIYFGSGDEAGKLAGITKHPANFIVLLPNAPRSDGLEAKGSPPGTAPRTAGQR